MTTAFIALNTQQVSEVGEVLINAQQIVSVEPKGDVTWVRTTNDELYIVTSSYEEVVAALRIVDCKIF